MIRGPLRHVNRNSPKFRCGFISIASGAASADLLHGQNMRLPSAAPAGPACPARFPSAAGSWIIGSIPDWRTAVATRGMLALTDLRSKIEAGEIDTVVVAFADHYGRLHGKRFDASFFLEEAAADGTHACDYLLTVDMEMEPVAGYSYASWEQGFGDFHLVPDLETLCVASWLDRTALVLCDIEDEKTSRLTSCLSMQLSRLMPPMTLVLK